MILATPSPETAKPAATPALTVTPEAPVSLPAETNAPAPGNGTPEPAVILPSPTAETASAPTAGKPETPATSQPEPPAEPLPSTQETPLPIIGEETPSPVPAAAETPEPVIPEPVTPAPAPATPVPDPQKTGSGQGSGTRNLSRYPVFSRSFPSRRLRFTPDPEAWAEIPRDKDTSSPLGKFLGD